MLTITLDGNKTKVDGKATILQAAREAGIAIPSLCSHQGLSGLGNCRLCVVEVEKNGRKRIVTSCNYPVEEGIAVTTNSPKPCLGSVGPRCFPGRVWLSILPFGIIATEYPGHTAV